MTIKDACEKLELTPLTDDVDYPREISDCYVGDLLSHVMAKAKADNLWITVQTNVNILAVATLTDVACIVLPEGIMPDKEIIDKANEQDINILSSKATATEIIKGYYGL